VEDLQTISNKCFSDLNHDFVNAVNEEAKNDIILISNSKPWFQEKTSPCISHYNKLSYSGN